MCESSSLSPLSSMIVPSIGTSIVALRLTCARLQFHASGASKPLSASSANAGNSGWSFCGNASSLMTSLRPCSCWGSAWPSRGGCPGGIVASSNQVGRTGCPRGSVGMAALLCRWQTAGGGSIPRWSASKLQVVTRRKAKGADQKKNKVGRTDLTPISSAWFAVLMLSLRRLWYMGGTIQAGTKTVMNWTFQITWRFCGVNSGVMHLTCPSITLVRFRSAKWCRDFQAQVELTKPVFFKEHKGKMRCPYFQYVRSWH